MKQKLFLMIVAEIQPFLGDRAEEFVRRQCVHIGVKPEVLEKKDIPSLARWVHSSAKLILSAEKVDQLFEKIKALGE